MEWNEVLSSAIGCYIALYLFHQKGKADTAPTDGKVSKDS
jgi:hypothetical protein